MDAEIAAFFTSYSAAFERFDVDWLAGHFAYPAHIASDDDGVRLIVLSSQQDYAQMIEPLLGAHAALDVRSGRTLSVVPAGVSPRLAHVTVEWAVHGQDLTAPLYTHRAIYALVKRDGAWKIASILVNELPALKLALSARGRRHA